MRWCSRGLSTRHGDEANGDGRQRRPRGTVGDLGRGVLATHDHKPVVFWTARGVERMAEDTVGLKDIAAGLPGLLKDAPAIIRGVLTGLPARRSAKTSIGKVFADRAARYG